MTMEKADAIHLAKRIKNECSKHKKCADCPFFDYDEGFCGIQGIPEDWDF